MFMIFNILLLTGDLFYEAIAKSTNIIYLGCVRVHRRACIYIYICANTYMYNGCILGMGLCTFISNRKLACWQASPGTGTCFQKFFCLSIFKF